METAQFLNYLALAALGLLVLVTLGIGYLTFLGWRDRRLQENEKRETRRSLAAKRK
ncbi:MULTISPECIES: hypothetical protein [Mastigocoleus]|uniref:hypothetical protein n=1 Tax=Mastigocoleus TaxID=996924 RepID=UPI0004050A69|nr:MULTISPECIES: hypothetical protein [Mastigocoleus]MDJ0692969.1 hypothetical protein [Mastigocoleus sp. MO_188.B34]MDJ0772760.1 hypothetical protein [Mastigocoleus sp. MO_167.B18]